MGVWNDITGSFAIKSYVEQLLEEATADYATKYKLIKNKCEELELTDGTTENILEDVRKTIKELLEDAELDQAEKDKQWGIVNG